MYIRQVLCKPNKKRHKTAKWGIKKYYHGNYKYKKMYMVEWDDKMCTP